MRARDYQVPEIFVKTLRRRLPGFMRLSPEQQVRMAYFVWITGYKMRSHDTLLGCSSFSYMELEKAFGRGKFNVLNKRLGVFNVTETWSKAFHVTKGYSLTASVQNIKDQYLTRGSIYVADESKAAVMFCMNAQPIVTLPQVLASKDTDGNTANAWRGVNLTQVVPVDLNVMKDLQCHLAKMHVSPEMDLFADASPDQIEYRVESLNSLIILSNTESAGHGRIAHRYMEQSTGRLGAVGISLQNAPRLVRKAALNGMYDYDIENCHYAIFSHLAKQYGASCSAIDHYLANKSETRAGIAMRIGITVSQVKTALLAIMFGSPLSLREGNAIPQAIGCAKAGQLYKDPEFLAIANDIKTGRKLILANWSDRTPRTLRNAMGKTISIKETTARKLAHLLQGIEARALRAVIEVYGESIVLPIHDGFVSSVALDVAQVERYILDATGISLKVSGERIEIPADFEFTKLSKAA